MNYIKDSYGSFLDNYYYGNYYDKSFFTSEYKIGSKDFINDINCHLNSIDLSTINGKQKYLYARRSMCSHPAYFIIYDNFPDCQMLFGEVAVCINCYAKKNANLLRESDLVIDLSLEKQIELYNKFIHIEETEELDLYIEKIVEKSKKKSK